MEIEIGSTRSHSLENSGRGYGPFIRPTNYMIMMVMMMMMMMR